MKKSRNRGTDLESGDVNNEGNNAREPLLPITNSVGSYGWDILKTSSRSSVAPSTPYNQAGAGIDPPLAHSAPQPQLRQS
jgi:hypothetical protein